MSKQINDINVLDFGRLISMLTIDTPISIEFDKGYGQKEGVWWSCQREHLTVWCLHQPSPGRTRFQHKPNNSARTMYNNFGRPETLLWLAEALGEDEEVIISVAYDIKDIKNCKSACSELRKRISFDRVIELIQCCDL